MRLTLQPTDVLLFRDGRPFDQGDQHTAKTVFPPSPRTLHGAIRAQILRNAGLTDSEARRCMRGDPAIRNTLDPATQAMLGTAEDLGQLGLVGPFGFWKRDATSGAGEPLLPAPLDLSNPHPEMDGESERWSRMSPVPQANLVSVAPWKGGVPPLQPLATETGDASEPPSDQLIGIYELQAYLTGSDNQFTLVPETQVFRRVRRIGIKMKDRRAEQGQIYEVEFLAFEDECGLAAEITTPSAETLRSALGTKGVLRLGGEGRTAAYSLDEEGELLGPLVSQKFKEELCSQLVPTKHGIIRFKLYLATDACWICGDRYEWFPQSVLQILRDCGARDPIVRAAAVGHFSVQGGWAMVGAGSSTGAPRRRFTAVPAGSVYHFEVNGTTATVGRIVDALHGQALSNRDPELGFGLGLVGTSDRGDT